MKGLFVDVLNSALLIRMIKYLLSLNETSSYYSEVSRRNVELVNIIQSSESSERRSINEHKATNFMISGSLIILPFYDVLQRQSTVDFLRRPTTSFNFEKLKLKHHLNQKQLFICFHGLIQVKFSLRARCEKINSEKFFFPKPLNLCSDINIFYGT